MTGDYEIREVPLSLRSSREMVGRFLLSQGLRPEEMSRYFGIFDSHDEMVGGGGLQGDIVKEIALSPALRGEALTNALISRIQQAAYEDGITSLKIFTKPENRRLFESLGYHFVGESAKAVMLETDARGISGYCARLRKLSAPHDGKRCGVIVMNCNPLTIGHRYLIEKAAGMVDHLWIIPVEEDKSEYPSASRRDMMRRVAQTLPNVEVGEGSQYVISRATFPSYFIKDLNEGTEAQMELDADIFSRHIAPALNATVRFVGTEPLDPLTCAYNKTLKEKLQPRGIEVVEIERLTKEGVAVSATAVRKLTASRHAGEALRLTSEEATPQLLARCAANALTEELELTPKPGLIDCHDNGAHADMDFTTMTRSIGALTAGFERLAMLAMKSELPRHSEIAEAGIAAEKEMLAATGGVNTHRGALFSLGLMIMAAARLRHLGQAITPEGLHATIKELAAGFNGAETSHGAEMRKAYGLKGAADLAKEGYADLFSSWLPFWKTVVDKPEGKHLLLLKIMSALPDTNVYHRGGADGALLVKTTASELLTDFSVERMAKANSLFIERNLSPGGSADMLALTLLAHSLTNNN